MNYSKTSCLNKLKVLILLYMIRKIRDSCFFLITFLKLQLGQILLTVSLTHEISFFIILFDLSKNDELCS